MNKRIRKCLLVGAAVVGGLSLATAGRAAQAPAETFTATASVKAAAAKGSAPVTIHITRYVSEAERQKVQDAVKANDSKATHAALAALPDAGYIELAKRKTPLKYAYARPTSGGRLVTVIATQPIMFVGGSAPDAKPKEGFDLALALLVLDEKGGGEGELAPAAKVKMDTAGAIVVDGYGAEAVRLVGIAKAKANAKAKAKAKGK